MNKKLPPAQLATPNELKESGRHEIAASINPLVADAFALYVKTKNFHWHVSGPHFRDYHKLFDEHAEQILNMVDTLAERLRKLGETTIRSIGHISRLQNIEDNDEEFVAPEQMLQELMNDNKNFAARMLAAHQICSRHHDFASTSILEIFMDETERRTWFLFETISESITSEQLALR